MEPVLQRILVVGGNGFIGSAVCKAALARGFKVTSISSSGRPYQTAKGRTPPWVPKVDWQTADALCPATYEHIMPTVNGVVHTLGTLLEDGGYKAALKEGDLGSLFARLLSVGGDPLENNTKIRSYETINRDAALRVCDTFLSATSDPGVETGAPKPFVFISAEDIFRPFIPARYIETKRAAERRIEEMMRSNPDYRGVYMRPSLVYHAHDRPLTTPIAAALDLSASLHSKIPPSIPSIPGIFRAIESSIIRSSDTPLHSMANAMTIPPIHVDHVAEAICVALDPARRDVSGVVDVKGMRELIGWTERPESYTLKGLTK